MLVTVKYNKLPIAPQKIRVILGNLRNKTVSDALSLVDHSTRQTATPVKKLLLSSISAAKDKDPNVKAEDLMVKEIYCNEGHRLYRTLIKGRGRASRIRKRSCHLTLTVERKLIPVKQTSKPATKKTDKAKTSNKKVEKGDTAKSK